ncbi:MAG: LamG-like jellyroll fold domain-containing protein, partial [Bacillota bacterium]
MEENNKQRIIFSTILKITLTIFVVTEMISAQQIKINRIEMMPNMPSPYQMRDWKEVAKGYDSLVFNLNLTGEYLPLIFIEENTVNYPEHKSFGLHTVVGTPNIRTGEAINVLPAVIGASLVGIDKSNQNGYNWVLMSEEYFNRRADENVYLNHPYATSGDDWWYETMPNVFFYQLYSIYPNTGDFARQFTTVAERWLEAIKAMGGSSTPWKVPNMDYRAFSFSRMTPNAQGVHEPEAAGAIAWILYNAHIKTNNASYRAGAELAMEFLNGLSVNPAYELQLSYGAYTAARMNAELRTGYDIEKIINWCFDVGPLRSWGAILGNWGGYDVSGLIGENSTNDYAFIMNNFEQAGALLPIVRYDKRFARAIGKWILNIANASRLFYPKYLPESNQDSYQWAMQYDPQSYIAHEAIRKEVNSKSPFATGDAIRGGWGKTNLTLYGSSHAGILGAILDTTNVPMILKLDAVKTDYFHKEAYPTYLYYNPYTENKNVEIDLREGRHDIYDVVSGGFLLKGATGKQEITIPADNAVLAVIAPEGGKISYDLDRMMINNVIVDYHYQATVANYPPRIKSLSADSLQINPKGNARLFCTATDKENDSLLYKWSASEGEIISGKDTAVFTAPNEAGKYAIKCIVTDSKGASDSATVEISVGLTENHAPVIKSLISHPGKLNLSESSTITCNAADPDNDLLLYSWHSQSGILKAEGSIAYWKAPPNEGDYVISCTVTDTAGGVTKDSVIAEVRDFSKYTSGSLIAYYPFNGNSNDLSGNNLNGTMGNVTFLSDRFGKPGSALLLTGFDSYVRIANNALLNFQNAITLSFWIKPYELPDRESFPVSHGSWQNRWKVSITPQNRIRWTIKTTSGIKDLDSKTIATKDSLYNVTAVFTGSDIELYINGELESFARWNGTISTTTYDLTIGQMLPADNNYNYQGIIDD